MTSPKDKKCCERDHDGDGNCDRHPAPLVKDGRLNLKYNPLTMDDGEPHPPPRIIAPVNEIYTFHDEDGNLLRSTKGRSYWARKKTWVFVDRKAAERQAAAMTEKVEVVRYVPAKDQ